tara:strand:- start:1 stop:201 length:201 start_codon:yes stop_codon:yes gene_type:complete
MVRTFYIPKDKEGTMLEFVEKATLNNVSYSKLIVQFMEDYIDDRIPIKVNDSHEYYNTKKDGSKTN